MFGATAYRLYGSGEGKLSAPFKSLLKFDPSFGPSERQTTGDCVSHSTRNAIDITRAVEIDIKGESESLRLVVPQKAYINLEGINGKGMTCSGAAKYVHSLGGILLRKDYKHVDLSKYNSTLGAKHQLPFDVYIKEASKHIK